MHTVKRRVTLTIDPQLVRHAKQIAHERKTSVSALIEELIRSASRPSEREAPTFAQKWVGQFTVRRPSRLDPRLEALTARYGLDEE